MLLVAGSMRSRKNNTWVITCRGAEEQSEYQRSNMMSGPFYSDTELTGWHWHYAPTPGDRWPPAAYPPIQWRYINNWEDGWILDPRWRDYDPPSRNIWIEHTYKAGYFYALPICKDPSVIVSGQGFQIAPPGAVFTEHRPWDGPHRYEIEQLGLSRYTPPVRFPDIAKYKEPKVIKRKVRKLTPYGGKLLPREEQWVSRLTSNHGHKSVQRTIGMLPTGGFAVDAKMNYFDDMDRTGVQAPRRIVCTGVAPRGAVGIPYRAIGGPTGKFWYCLDIASGPYAIERATGKITIFAGWDRKGLHRAHGGLWDNNQLQFFNSTHRIKGEWGQVRGLKQFFEPWDLMMIPNPADPHGYHEGIVCDTKAKRLLLFDHSSAHAHGTAFYPGVIKAWNYKPPTALGGETTVASYIDKHVPGVTPEMIADPWGGFYNELDGLVYYTCYTSGDIYRIDPRKEMLPELFARPARVVGDGELGYNGWRAQSRAHENQLRSAFAKGGPPGTAMWARPQAINRVDRKIIWVCRYLYTVFAKDMDGGNVEIFAHIPRSYLGPTGIPEFGALDVNMVVDHWGAVGPKNAVRLLGFNNKDVILDSVGNPIGDSKIFGEREPRTIIGPFSQFEEPQYIWLGGIMKEGVALYAGTVGESHVEVSMRNFDDPVINWAKYGAGEETWRQKLMIAYGPHGQNDMGLPSMDMLGAYSEEQLEAEFAWCKVTKAEIPNLKYMIEIETHANDYSDIIVDPPHPDAQIVHYTLEPAEVEVGKPTTAAWKITGADRALLHNMPVEFEGTKQLVFMTPGDLMITLQAESHHGGIEKSLPLKVIDKVPPPPPPPSELELLKIEHEKVKSELVMIDKVAGERAEKIKVLEARLKVLEDAIRAAKAQLSEVLP